MFCDPSDVVFDAEPPLDIVGEQVVAVDFKEALEVEIENIIEPEEVEEVAVPEVVSPVQATESLSFDW
ncbi:hypothetical protein D3C87_1825580 [compost metagenome]